MIGPTKAAYPALPPCPEASRCPAYPGKQYFEPITSSHLPLHVDEPAMLGVEPAQGVQQQLGLHADVDLHGLSGGLHPAGRVHGVPEEAVAGHLAAHHPGHHGAGVDPDPWQVQGTGSPQEQLLLGPVGDHEDAGAGEQVQGHRGDLRRVPVTILHWQARGNHVAVINCFHLKAIKSSSLF